MVMRRNAVSVIKFIFLCSVFVTTPFMISYTLNYFFPIDDYPVDYMHQVESLPDIDIPTDEGSQRIDLNSYINHDTHKDVFDPAFYMTKNIAAVNSTEQALVDYIGSQLAVRYEVISNYESTWKYTAKLSLTNNGSEPIRRSEWSLYVFHFTFLQVAEMRDNHSALVGDGQFNISHVDGSLYMITPTELFTMLGPGDTKEILLVNSGSFIAQSDAFPNWYVTSRNSEPRILASTEGTDANFLGTFDSKEKWKRSQLDLFDPLTPEERYFKNAKAHDFGQTTKPVIPTPLNLTKSDKKFKMTEGPWIIVCDEHLKMEANILSGHLDIPVKLSVPSSHYIRLKIGTVPISSQARLNLMEAYRIEMSVLDMTVTITGASTAGVYYGIQTLISLYSFHGRELQVVEVTDAPRFGFRGLMLDVSRNFFPIYEIVKILDGMATYKLNKLHLHLTDDQGWRLEIPGLEELTRIGSERSHNYTIGLAIPPFLGSGPFANNSGSGYYSVQEYRMILRHAKSRHITVIPEFDSPGHSYAAMTSMEARYRKYSADNDRQEAEKYRLVDETDRSAYYAPGAHRWSTLNPCMDSTYMFVEHVMTAVKAMHQDIMPLEVFHMGGDEVPRDALKNSSVCAKFRVAHPEYNTTAMLVSYFIKRVAEVADRHNLKLQMWEDGALDDLGMPFDLAQFPGSEVTCNLWNTLWESGRGHRTAMFANSGYKVILSHATHLYFDHPQEPDPAERGLYWARRAIDTHKTFNYAPDSIYDNMDEDKNGREIVRAEACAGMVNCLPIEQPENIIGMQGHLWSETIRTSDHLESMLYPRLLALAERAWHRASWESVADTNVRTRLEEEDWEGFANALGHRELERLEAQKINYYLPPPGALVTSGEIKANVAFPGLNIQYSPDGGASWSDLLPGYKFDSGKVLLATRSYNQVRRGRPVTVIIP